MSGSSGYLFDGGDVFRVVPIRYIGITYPVYEMIFLKVHPANEREHEESSSGSNNALTVSLVYAGCHAAYRTVVATTEAMDSGFDNCPVPNRIGFIALTTMESLCWDMVASIVLPYSFGYFFYWLFDNVAFGALSHQSPVRRWVPHIIAVSSMPILGPVYDMFADRMVASVISRHSLCH